MKNAQGLSRHVWAGVLLLALSTSLTTACRATGSPTTPETTSTVREVVGAFAAGQDRGMWGHADLAALRTALQLAPEDEVRLTKLVSDDGLAVVSCLDGVREFGFFTNVDTPGDEVSLLVWECASPPDIDRVVSALDAELLGGSPNEKRKLEGATWYALRLTDTCVVAFRTDWTDGTAHDRLPVDELLSIQIGTAKASDLPASTVRMAGRGMDLPWPVYNFLVFGAGKILEENPEATRLLGLEAYARACGHVDRSFENGGRHCESIQRFELEVDVEERSMTWDLHYDQEKLHGILLRAITSMPVDVAEGIHLDTTGSEAPWIRLRHDQPDVRLDTPAVDAALQLTP